MSSNQDFAKAILASKDIGSARLKPGLYLLRINKAGVKKSTRENDFRSFFRLDMEVVKVVEDGTRYTIAPNPVVPPLGEGEECSSVVEVPGKEGYGFREVKGMLKTLTGLTDDQLNAPAMMEDGKTPRLVNGQAVTTIEALIDYDLSLLAPVVFLGRAQNIIDRKTKTFRVSGSGAKEAPFVKLDVVRTATDEELGLPKA